MVSIPSLIQMQKWNLIANFVTNSYCFEYDMAIENGLRLANKHSDLESEDDQEQISQQKAEIILRCVETATRKVKDSFPASTINERACNLLKTATSEDKSRYNKAYKHFPEITMKSTLLNAAYHPIANLIIIEAFSNYQSAIEQGKTEAMNKIERMDNVTIQLVLQEVHKSIGKSCMTVRIDVDALMERDEFRACISQSCDRVNVKNGLQDFEIINENVSDQTASISTNKEQQSRDDNRNSLGSTSSERLSENTRMNSISRLLDSSMASEDAPATEGSSSTSQEAAYIIDLSNDDEEDDVTHNAGIHKRLRKARHIGFYREDSDADEGDEDHTNSRRRSFYDASDISQTGSSTCTANYTKKEALYEDKVRALLDEGITSRLYDCAGSQSLQGYVYLTREKRFTFHLSSRWLGQKSLKIGDVVTIKMRIGKELSYTSDKKGVGASLEISKDQYSNPLFLLNKHGKGSDIIREIIKSRSSF